MAPTTLREDHSAESITPELLSPPLAIEAGYNMYLADIGDPKSPISRSAAIAVKEFEELIGQFPSNTKGGLYCYYLRLAANSLAKGIVRCKEQLKRRQKAAEDELQQLIVEITDGERAAGRLKSVWNALLVGGVVYFFAQVVFGVTMQGKGASTERQNVTLAIAIAFPLLYSEFRGWLSRRSKRRMYARYKKALDDADAEYRRKAREEYSLSARLAELAWEQMTNMAPPVTNGFRNLLEGAITNWSSGVEDAVYPADPE